MKKNSPRAATAPNADDRAWKIAQLAATLASKTYVQPGEVTLMTQNNRKVELGWAIEQAQFLLAGAEHAARIRHAYDLFDSGWYSIDKARRIFEEHSWPRLRGWQSVEGLLEEILKKLKAVSQPPSPNSAALELGLNLPRLTPPSNALFWRDPETLTAKHGENRVYQVREILQAAHAYLREQFRDRIENSVDH
jgi:hypothetical protein